MTSGPASYIHILYNIANWSTWTLSQEGRRMLCIKSTLLVPSMRVMLVSALYACVEIHSVDVKTLHKYRAPLTRFCLIKFCAFKF